MTFRTVCRRCGELSPDVNRKDTSLMGQEDRVSKLDLYLLMLGYVLLFLWLLAWRLG
jgi:hypothetical protein